MPDDRLFVRTPLIPQADLQADNVFPAGQYIYGPVGQVLSYGAVQTPAGNRLAQGDTLGRQSISRGLVQQQNIIPPRTDTATVIGVVVLPTPPFEYMLAVVRVTAVSGTTPQMVVTLESSDSQGVFSSGNGGGTVGTFTTVSSQAVELSTSFGNTQQMMAPLYRVHIVMTGTAPSFTWYMDINWK